ncbi:MAG: PLP-dependent cysteine synthase family protein [Bacteroidota bacterium]
MIATTIDTHLKERIKALGKFVGNTPLFPLQNVVEKPDVKIYAKLEWQQFGGSVKARPAYNIIKSAIYSGELTEGKHILDASSGNTAIAYAAIGAAINVPVTICLPKNASEERKQILKSFGAHIHLTSPFGTTDEAQQIAQSLFEEQPHKYFYANQYGNDNNWKAHYNGTAEEIFRQTDGSITHFVTGLGTTGSFTGTGRKLKEIKPDIHLTSLQPDAALHGLEGWKHLETAILPGIYDDTIADQNLEIDTYEALDTLKRVANTEGLLISPSSAANLTGALKVANTIDEGVIVTLFPDNAEKYGEVIKNLFGDA